MSVSLKLTTQKYRTFVAKDALRPDASISHFGWIVLVSSPTFTWISQHPSFGRRSINRPLIKEILESFCESWTMVALIISSNAARSRCNPCPNGFRIACRSSIAAVAHADALPVHNLWTPEATCLVRDLDNDPSRWCSRRMASGGSDSPIYTTTFSEHSTTVD